MKGQKKPPETPRGFETLVQAIREVPGWKLASLSTRRNNEGRWVTKLRFSHRGGFVFPNRHLKVDGVYDVRSWVDKGTAHVWVSWNMEMAKAGSD